MLEEREIESDCVCVFNEGSRKYTHTFKMFSSEFEEKLSKTMR